MHFSLRTLLIIVTATAIYVGFHLGMLRSLYGSGWINSMSAVGLLAMCYRLPLFLIWSLGAATIYPHRGRPGAKLVLAAIGVAFAWLMLSPFFQWLFLQSRGSSYGMTMLQWYGTIQAVLDGTSEAISWGLLLGGFWLASEAGKGRNMQQPTDVQQPTDRTPNVAEQPGDEAQFAPTHSAKHEVRDRG
jgi:hypothetical protein